MVNGRRDKTFPAILRRQVGKHPPGTVGIVIRIGSKRIACTYGFRPAAVAEDETSEYVPARRKDFMQLRSKKRNDGKQKKPRTH